LHGDVVPLVVDSAQEFINEGFSVGDLFEEVVCEFGLGVGPCFDIGGGDGLFEPPVGVGDGDSVVAVFLVGGFCGGVHPVLCD